MARKDLKTIAANAGHLGEVASPQSTDAVGLWRGVAGAMLVGWTTAANFLTRAQATQAQAALGSDAATDMSPLRVRQAINTWMRGAKEVSGTYALNTGTDPASSDFGKYIRVNNSLGVAVIQLPDVTVASVPSGPFCQLSITSSAQLASITVAISGQLRSQAGVTGWDTGLDTVYVGLTAALADETIIDVFKTGTLWFVRGMIRAVP